MATTYGLVLRGEIGDHFHHPVRGHVLTRTAGTTGVTGPVRDQAHLHGLIEHISAQTRAGLRQPDRTGGGSNG